MGVLLTIESLTVAFEVAHPVVRDVSLSVSEGETLALVGESGSGKSVTAQTLLGLNPTAKVLSGKICFREHNLLTLDKKRRRSLCGRTMGYVFQDPYTALNPTMKIGKQVTEGMCYHLGFSRSQAYQDAVSLLRQLEFSDPERILNSYPHALSGGMRQRIVLAIALACSPELLIADEPTTALDPTVRSEILSLLIKLQQKRQMSLILITHDLAIVPHLANRVAVMYAGQLVETGTVKQVWSSPQHPYTQALLEGNLTLNQDKSLPLKTIKGQIPSHKDLPAGCPFHPRCPYKQGKCLTNPPESAIRCWFPLRGAHAR
ncbi:MAG: ABC transporter ATP-binding protein [Chlamydiia bacterium]|nr:ABC transporter ATP-binding protein [Chlamydiia bacterium]